MKVFLVVSREYDQNAYCCFDPETREGVIIDPGFNCEGIVSFLNTERIAVKAILLTHGHFDHIMSTRRVSDFTKAELYAHRLESELLADPLTNMSEASGNGRMSLCAEKQLEDGDGIRFGNETLRVIHTPGHTPGGVCFYSESDKIIFTGDTLFWETVGRTDLPFGDGYTLTRSINDRLLTLPEETIVYPGHGRPTDIRHEAMIHSRIV
ncbi:MAG: MBL fold metallo-hydrolase [Clostridiales bacterium]|jgi:glyoxylase-like metal-dependent hydrolase (beta-lactamase superfamily II)|nr:MBL fold metallo-hydrolase [Clostridiales bacterium]